MNDDKRPQSERRQTLKREKLTLAHFGVFPRKSSSDMRLSPAMLAVGLIPTGQCCTQLPIV
jgi:hypothetical protein